MKLCFDFSLNKSSFVSMLCQTLNIDTIVNTTPPIPRSDTERLRANKIPVAKFKHRENSLNEMVIKVMFL